MTNVLVLMADDMRYDHWPYMVGLRQRMRTATVFDSARCNVALCQPNRSGLFTGQLSKHHGELSVGFAGLAADDHDNTPAKWIADEGVRCGLMGKYQNWTDGIGGITRPDGWDSWREFSGGANSVTFDVRVDEAAEATIADGRTQIDYIEDEALAFLEGSEPWFLYVSFQQPHSPFAPEPADFFKWAKIDKTFPTEVDFSSKPAHMTSEYPTAITYADKVTIRADWHGRLMELAAVDRVGAALIDAIDANDQLDDTIVIFTSDNGVHEGEHRRLGSGTKGGPYDVGLRVPFLVMGPGFVERTITAPVYPTQDIAATLVEVYGATPGQTDQAGVSLRTISADPVSYEDRVLLHEIGEGFHITGDGVTTGPDHSTLPSLKLFRYPSVRTDADGPFTYEMYDLDTDPDEMHNVSEVGGRLAERNALEAILDGMLA